MYDDDSPILDGQVIDDESTVFDAAFGPPRGPQPLVTVGESYSAPTLGQLLVQYNSMLGWSQAKLAKEMGKDSAEISRIVSGRHKRPQDRMLELIASTYQAHGLTAVTVDLLKAARDNHDKPVSNPWGISPHWLRLIQSILALSQEQQDAMYRIMSTQLREISLMLARRDDD